jgi:hypothetical protein
VRPVARRDRAFGFDLLIGEQIGPLAVECGLRPHYDALYLRMKSGISDGAKLNLHRGDKGPAGDHLPVLIGDCIYPLGYGAVAGGCVGCAQGQSIADLGDDGQNQIVPISEMVDSLKSSQLKAPIIKLAKE